MSHHQAGEWNLTVPARTKAGRGAAGAAKGSGADGEGGGEDGGGGGGP